MKDLRTAISNTLLYFKYWISNHICRTEQIPFLFIWISTTICRLVVHITNPYYLRKNKHCHIILMLMKSCRFYLNSNRLINDTFSNQMQNITYLFYIVHPALRHYIHTDMYHWHGDTFPLCYSYHMEMSSFARTFGRDKLQRNQLMLLNP